LDVDRIKLAGLVASPALHTFIPIELMGYFLFSMDCIHRANPHTSPTTCAFFRIDQKGDEFFTKLGWTFFFFDVSLIFSSKILEGRQNRIRSC
jgi:hypothetical protein